MRSQKSFNEQTPKIVWKFDKYHAPSSNIPTTPKAPASNWRGYCLHTKSKI